MLGGRADLIFVFFDPIGQALCKRTLNVVGEYVPLSKQIPAISPSIFVSSMLYNFCWERHTESILTGLVG